MSGGTKCHCDESKKPLQDRDWNVTQLKCNNSYFQAPKGGSHPSDYSTVCCNRCSAMWRTKAGYVFEIKQMKGAE